MNGVWCRVQGGLGRRKKGEEVDGGRQDSSCKDYKENELRERRREDLRRRDNRGKMAEDVLP